MKRTTTVAFVTLTLAARPASPQEQPTPARPEQQIRLVAPDDETDPWLKSLSKHYGSGDWAGLYKTTSELTKTLGPLTNADAEAYPRHPCLSLRDGGRPGVDPNTRYYRILFVDPDSPDARAIAFLFHEGAREFTADLPGLKDEGICQLFLTYDADASVASSYASTRVANTLVGQLPAVVKTIGLEGGLGRILAGDAIHALGTTGKLTTTRAQPVIYGLLSMVRLPHRRASIDVTDTAIQHATPDLKQIQKDAETLSEWVRTREGRLCTCVQRLATAQRDSVSDFHWSGNGTVKACRTDGVPECWKALAAGLDEAYTDTMAPCHSLSPECLGIAVRTDDKFHAIVTPPQPVKSEGTFKYSNLPLTRFSLGLLSAVILDGAEASDRVKLDQGVFASNSLVGTPLAAAIFNYHPWPYDERNTHLTGGEVVRLFAGAAVTPLFGPTVGVGLSPLRGLSFNGGVAWLLAEHPRHGEQVKDEPVEPERPFRLRMNRVLFLGLAYNFGG